MVKESWRRPETPWIGKMPVTCLPCQETQIYPGDFFYEEYIDEAAFKLHLESSHFLEFNTDCQDMVKSKIVNTYLRMD